MDAKFLRKTRKGTVRTFTLGDGQSVSIDVAELPTNVYVDAADHGVSQKIGDSVAGLSKDKRYAEAFEIMSAGIAALLAGKWNTGRESTSTSDLVTALCELKDMEPQDVEPIVAKADEDTLKKWLKHPKIDAIIKRLRAERADRAAAEADDLDIEL